jgi:hypothetical protein
LNVCGILVGYRTIGFDGAYVHMPSLRFPEPLCCGFCMI